MPWYSHSKYVRKWVSEYVSKWVSEYVSVACLAERACSAHDAFLLTNCFAHYLLARWLTLARECCAEREFSQKTRDSPG